MTMLLGGRAAEQLVFGSVTTGASDDLKRVAEIARAMVHEYAMGTGSSSLRAIDDGAVRGHPPGARRGGPRARRRGVPGGAQALVDAPPRPARRSSPPRCSPNEVLERADIDRIMGDVPRAAPLRDRRAVGGRRDRGQSGAPRPARKPDLPRLDAVRHRPRRRGRRGSSTPRCALYRDSLGMPLVHRETVEEQGVDAALLDVGDGHVELLAPLGPDTAGGQVPGPAGAPACTTSPTAWPSIEETLEALQRRRRAADRRAPAHRHSRLPGRLSPSVLHRRRAHRDRPACTCQTKSPRRSRSASKAARC